MPTRKPIRFVIVFLLLLAASFNTGTASEKTTAVKAVDSIGMTVSDMDTAVDFYSKVLSFEKISDTEVWGSEYERLKGVFGVRMRVVRLRLGDEVIELTDYLTPEGRPYPQGTRSNDGWFQHIAIVVSDMDKAFELLRKNKVTFASTAPQTIPEWNKAAAGIRAFYFRDPDGHFLEIIYFPPGKGNSKWHGKNAGLFLGIDHTAIVVADTDESLKFYRDTLGMKVAGESNNYGTEQEHLNNVFGASLRITSLKAPSGPGIEFLEYMTPGDGRPIPEDEKANDVAHWETNLAVEDAADAEATLRSGNYSFVSPETTDVPEETLGFDKGFLVRDPDGHVMQVIEKNNDGE